MSFDEQLQAAATVIAAEFAQAAAYTPPGGEPAAVTLVAGEVRDADEESQDGRATFKTATAYVQASEIADPVIGGAITLDGVVYRIVAKIKDPAGWQLELAQSETTDRHEPGLRRER